MKTERDMQYEINEWFAEMIRDEEYQYNDGGRSDSGRKGTAGDCVCRAIAIALELPYDQVYRELAQANQEAGGKRSARNGLYRSVYEAYLNKHGWVWHSAPKLEGRKARFNDLPQGRLIARMARHVAAVIDGKLHDTWDSRHKMVYGYFAREN